MLWSLPNLADSVRKGVGQGRKAAGRRRADFFPLFPEGQNFWLCEQDRKTGNGFPFEMDTFGYCEWLLLVVVI